MRQPPFLVDQLTGRQPFRACAFDRRFSYCTYVPKSFTRETASRFRMLVAVHGTSRTAEGTRDLYVELAEEMGLILLAPLFPCAMIEQETHNYFWMSFGGIRYDQVMLAMIDEVAARYGISGEKVAMVGFSGGGQFTHRFLYLHPLRLSAASIGAPGMATRLDPSREWFVGTRDVSSIFGTKIDLDAIRKVPVHIVVGNDDVHPEILVSPGSPLYMPGVNDMGNTRVERARALHENYLHNGLNVHFDVVTGATHAVDQVLLAVESFLRGALEPEHGRRG